MNKTIIENTLKFLQRTELKWNEVPAFIECMQFLTWLDKQEEKDNINKEEVSSNNS